MDFLLGGDSIQANAGDGVRGEQGGEAGGFPGIAGGVETDEERGGEDVARACRVGFGEFRGVDASSVAVPGCPAT